MNFTSTQFVTSRRMAAYEPLHQISMWEETFKNSGNFNASASIIVEADTKLSAQVQFLIFRSLNSLVLDISAILS